MASSLDVYKRQVLNHLVKDFRALVDRHGESQGNGLGLVVEDFIKTGVMPTFDIQTSNDDPATSVGRSTKIYNNCVPVSYTHLKLLTEPSLKSTGSAWVRMRPAISRTSKH